MMNDPESRKDLLEYFYSDRSELVELLVKNVELGLTNPEKLQSFFNNIWADYVYLSVCAYSLGYDKEKIAGTIKLACA